MSKVRYFVEKCGADGPRWYWQPSASLRASGWQARRLWADTRDAAMAQAAAINQRVDDWSAALPDAEQPALPAAAQAAARRGDQVRGGRPYLYVIGSEGGQQKIGISRWPEKRRRELETAAGRKLEIWLLVGGRISHARKIEALSHQLLADTRREGEWFAVTPAAAVGAVARALEQTTAISSN